MARRLALLCLAFLLTACSQDGGKEAFTDSRTPPALSPRFFPPEGWAWGLVQAGDYPPQRYGVAAPPTGIKAHILILPGYGESAEAWFETVSALNGRGYTVWVLDGAGQGGSGRFTLPRDVGHVPSLEPDLQGIKAMLAVVIPQDGAPVFLLGSQSGGLLALSAGNNPANAGVIASATGAPSPVQPYDSLLSRIGLGGFRPPGEPGWSRDSPYRTGQPGQDSYRAQVQQLWQQANPDLRMGAPSVGRRLAMARAFDDAGAALAGRTTPTLLIGGAPALTHACGKAADCTALPAPAGAKSPYLQLESDGPRTAWLTMIDRFIDERLTARLAAKRPTPDHGV